MFLIFKLLKLVFKWKEYFMNLDIWNFVFYIVLFICPLLFYLLNKFFKIVLSLILSSLNKLFVDIYLNIFILLLYFIILSALIQCLLRNKTSQWILKTLYFHFSFVYLVYIISFDQTDSWKRFFTFLVFLTVNLLHIIQVRY